MNGTVRKSEKTAGGPIDAEFCDRHLMKSIVVLYATREGHSRLIAERVAAALRTQGFLVDVRNLKDDAAPIKVGVHSAAIFAGSVHAGSHERELVKFVKTHRDELDLLPTALISVSLSQAGAEMLEASPQARTRSANDVQKTIDKFVEDTGWHPRWIEPVAGALVYSKYNPLVKLIMRQIAKKAGAGTDTSRDYVYTDWDGLDRFCKDLALWLSPRPKKCFAPFPPY